MAATSTQDLTMIEWSARVRCKEHELGGSYSVLIFIGPVPDNPQEWRPSPSYVGMHGVYTDSGHEAGSSDQVTQGFIKLNRALVRADLPSLREIDVAPYLRTNLDWRVQKVTGAVVPMSDVPSLEVEVLSVLLRRGPTDKFPTPVGNPTQYPEITAGRPGGHQD